MSYLRYLCLFAYIDVQHTLRCVVCLVSCVPYVSSFSGLFIVLLPLRFSLTFMYMD